MNKLDEQIRQALNDEDQRLAAEMQNEAGLFDLVAMSFRGRQGWMIWYSWIMGFVIFALGIFCLTRFFATDDLKRSLAWALAVITCLFILNIVKTLSWMQMQKLELMREIKRLELRLSQRLDDRAVLSPGE